MKQSKIVIYDGVCNLCNGVVSWINSSSKDKFVKFRFVPFQSEEGQFFLKKNNFRLDKLETVIVIENGFFYTHSEAFLQITEHLRSWKEVTKMIRLIPLSYRDSIYKVFAKNRIKWFGVKNTNSCSFIVSD